MRENSVLIFCLLQITILLTNLTQIPDLVTKNGVKLLSYVPWVLFAFLIITLSMRTDDFIIGTQKYLYFSVMGILLVCLILEIQGKNGLDVSLLRPLLISLFIFVVSMNIGKYIDSSQLNDLLLVYAFSGVIVAIFVYRTILSNGFSWTSRVYAYNSKNSVSQIILTAILFLIYLHGRKNRLWNIGMEVLIGALIFELFMLKSRASLLGLAIIFISVLISKEYKKSTKIIVILVLVVFGLILIFNTHFRYFFIDSIILAGRDSTNLNSISSGRMDMLIEFPELFWKKPVIGYGRYYVECMPLDALIETGIIGGVLFNIIALSPIVYSIKSYICYRQPIDFLLIIIGICYYINGLFEQLAPFGPGVKCYILWLLFEVSVIWRMRYSDENTIDYEYANNI